MKLLLSVGILLAGAFAASAQITSPDTEAPATIPDGLCNDSRNNPVELREVCPPTPAPGETTGNSSRSIDSGITSGIQQAPLLGTPPPLLRPDNRLDGNPAISPPAIR